MQSFPKGLQLILVEKVVLDEEIALLKIVAFEEICDDLIGR
jgi:hypothetical protein